MNAITGGILGGGGGGGAADDDDDFGFTRFFNTAGDFMTDFFGGDSSTKNKKKPNEGISINEKTKKKTDIVKKTAKNSANKVKDEDDESLLGELEDELTEELDDKDEKSSDQTEEGELKEVEKEKDDDTDEYKDEEEDVSVENANIQKIY